MNSGLIMRDLHSEKLPTKKGSFSLHHWKATGVSYLYMHMHNEIKVCSKRNMFEFFVYHSQKCMLNLRIWIVGKKAKQM